jgi:acetyl-CoA C-acetyltransferase
MADPRTPCIIGAAQKTVRPGPGVESPEPLELWEEVARKAAADAGDPGLLGGLDHLQIVYCQSWQYDDPPGRLCERLGTSPRYRHYSGIGGTTPQVLVGLAAEAIGSGQADLALVVGAEALETRRQLAKQGRKPAWSHKDPERKPFPFEAPLLPTETNCGFFPAYLTFPSFDLARRAHLGIEPQAYRRMLGELMAPLTRVAANNPYAWFPVERSAEELLAPTASNRMVGYPYTKYMVSVMDVDMSAAVLLASEEEADRLKVAPDKRVYLRGWCYATDVTYLAERHEMWKSEAMAAASAKALELAGVGLDQVEHLDLYSCFASSLNFARDALGLAADDPRSLTVTGGLPFFGGAGSDYMTHSIATMAEVLRRQPGSFGLVSGVGMHMTKHVFGVYGTEPGGQASWGAGPAVRQEVQARLDALPKRRIVDSYSGEATVVSYTVSHGRDGAAEFAPLVCELADGSRCYGRIEEAGLLEEAEACELVGRRVELASPGSPEGVNLVTRLLG